MCYKIYKLCRGSQAKLSVLIFHLLLTDLVYVEIGVNYDHREQSVATDIVDRILHGPVPLVKVPKFMSQVAQLVAFKKCRSSIRGKDRGWDYFFEI